MTDSIEKVARRSRWSHKRLIPNLEMNKEPTSETLNFFRIYEYYAHAFQILLPDFNFCPPKFIQQIENKEKKVIRLIEARDFYLPADKKCTSDGELYAYCVGHPVLKEYMPDDVLPDRGFILKILATLDLQHLLEFNKKLLKERYLLIIDRDQDERQHISKHSDSENSDRKLAVKKYMSSEDDLERYLSELESLTDEELSEDTKGYIKKQENLVTP